MMNVGNIVIVNAWICAPCIVIVVEDDEELWYPRDAWLPSAVSRNPALIVALNQGENDHVGLVITDTVVKWTKLYDNDTILV